MDAKRGKKMVYFSINPTTFPEIIFAHQFAQENYHHHFTYANNNIEIAYIKSGALILTIGKDKFLAEDGSFLILPHNCDFTIEAKSKELHIHYTLNLHVCSDITLYNDAAEVPANDSGVILPVLFPPCEQSQALFHRLNHLIQEHHKCDKMNKYKCGCKAFELLCDISLLSNVMNTPDDLQSKPIPQIYCLRIKDYIHKNIQQTITLSDLSIFLEKSPDYLNRVFKNENGISILQYANREKVKKCVELMTTKGYSLNQCCDYVGIKDPNYLSRLFKKHMGIGASQFKRNSVYSTFPLVDKKRL